MDASFSKPKIAGDAGQELSIHDLLQVDAPLELIYEILKKAKDNPNW